jgi:hypothetical protein
MFSTLFKPHRQLIVFAGLAAIILPALHAEPNCPGNVVSVTPRFVQRALIVIPVKINHQGPFDFVVDAGSQITIIDPTLASQLDLKSQAVVRLVSVAGYAQASVTALDALQVVPTSSKSR